MWQRSVRVLQGTCETVVRCAVGVTEEFKVELGLRQGSVLNFLLLSIATEGLTDEVRQKSTWSVMFAGDIVGAPTLWRRWRRRILEVWVCPAKDMNEGYSHNKTYFVHMNKMDVEQRVHREQRL